MMTSPTIRALPLQLEKIAETELNENSQTILSGLEGIKNWLSKQKHITSRTDDQFLIAFLRGSKHSIERAKEKLEAYYTIRTAIPEIFLNRDPFDEKMKKIMELGIMVYLPKPHSTGARIILSCPYTYDPKYVSIYEVLKYAFTTLDLAVMNDDNLTVAGQIIITDLKGMSVEHSTQITPIFLKKFTKIIQEAYPYRQKSIHFLNLPKIFDFLFKIFYGLMNEKLRKRIFVHDNLESLHRHVPKNLLPIEYGGELGSMNVFLDQAKGIIFENRKWILDDDYYRTDETKRIGKSKYSDLFGMDGSFRQLNFD